MILQGLTPNPHCGSSPDPTAPHVVPDLRQGVNVGFHLASISWLRGSARAALGHAHQRQQLERQDHPAPVAARHIWPVSSCSPSSTSAPHHRLAPGLASQPRVTGRRPRCKDRLRPLIRRESHRPQESAHGCFPVRSGGDLDPQEHRLSAHVEEDLLPTGQKIRKRCDAG